MSKVIVFKFIGVEGLESDEKGNFTYKGLPCRKVYNSGSIQVRQNKFKFSKGLIALRKLAIKTEKQKEELPF